jgi:DNA-binding FrmR family transcriptional regulator
MDVLTQLAASQEALRQVGLLLLRNHIEASLVVARITGETPALDEMLALVNSFGPDG